jgi:hypothetical protein
MSRLLLRTNFLMDAEDRGCWLDRNEPTAPITSCCACR